MNYSSYYFTNATILEVSGKHAERYTNARLSNDIRLATEQQAIEAAALTPQGRVQAYFSAIKTPLGYLLYCTGGERELVIQAFKHFIVADQVVVVDRSADYQLWHVSAEPSELTELLKVNMPQAFLGCSITSEMIVINRPRIAACGFDLLGADLIAKYPILVDRKLTDAKYNYARIKSGQLAYPDELDDSFMFAESGLTHAVSNRKGCYAGQEAIEMLNARGQAANIIYQIETTGLINVEKGSSVFMDLEKNDRAGSVLSSSQDTDRNSTIVMVKIRSKIENFRICFLAGQQWQRLM